jgi:hydroxymethylbilane synthase
MTQTLTVATRRSLLALTQTRAFVGSLKLAHPGLEVAELLVTTTGDMIQDRPLAELGGKGLFVKEIEHALLERRADLAVHSMKDVPAELAQGLALAAIPLREDPRDVSIGRGGTLLEQLPEGACIGTSSLRRQVQLAAWRSDLRFFALRGNVDTRIRRCQEGVVDAILLAAAGLVRLGWLDRATQFLPVESCLPAVGQGALAIECRADDISTQRLLEPLHHPETALRVAAERGVQRAIGGGCQVPLAAYADRNGENLRLRGLLAGDSGGLWRSERSILWPVDEGEAVRVGEEMGRELLEMARNAVIDCPPCRTAR